MIARIPREVWKQRGTWITALSECCSNIFIEAKGKIKAINERILDNETIVTIKIFHIKKVLLQPSFETRSKLHINRKFYSWFGFSSSKIPCTGNGKEGLYTRGVKTLQLAVCYTYPSFVFFQYKARFSAYFTSCNVWNIS